MCGINGLICKSTIDLKERLNRMNAALLHRGPDRQNIWTDERNKVGFGHTRLSILDLSDNGNQPMISNSGRFVIVLNGEIYNYKQLRNNLEKETHINWKGTSDTEVLLEAISFWGLKTVVLRCIGMFAFALFDKMNDKLFIVRDRMGEKPLYFGRLNSNFVFSSEISGIAALPEFTNRISRNSLGLYLQHSSVPEPYSIYEDIFKLNCGAILEYDIATDNYSIETYWNILDEIRLKEYSSENDAVEDLNNLLISSIGMQMQADVPTGAFLSGGIDSSTVAAIMQSLSSQKIDTFSIGFYDSAYDEANYARKVAAHIGSDHHELYVGENELLSVVPKLSSIYSEPFSEASQIPSFLVSQLAKKHVTVALSGDAGDELFCGYWRYHFANRLWNNLRKFPLPFRTAVYSLLTGIPYGAWRFILLPLSLKNGSKDVNYLDKMLKFLPLLKMESREELYQSGLMTHNREIDLLLNEFENTEKTLDLNSTSSSSYYEFMMYSDLTAYLPNNNLTKVDRASMAVSLESRVPLLDHRIVSYALSLPLEYKFRNNTDKWVLKQVLYKYVPKDFFERPKKGFSVPLSYWLRGSLYEWAESLLNERKIKEQGFFNYRVVNKYWTEHQSKKRNWSVQLWDIIMFQDWLDKQKGEK